MVDGVIVVGRLNKTTRDEAQALHAQLESLDAPVLGVVANGTSRGRGYYGYYRHGRRSMSGAAVMTGGGDSSA